MIQTLRIALVLVVLAVGSQAVATKKLVAPDQYVAESVSVSGAVEHMPKLRVEDPRQFPLQQIVERHLYISLVPIPPGRSI